MPFEYRKHKSKKMQGLLVPIQHPEPKGPTPPDQVLDVNKYEMEYAIKKLITLLTRKRKDLVEQLQAVDATIAELKEKGTVESAVFIAHDLETGATAREIAIRRALQDLVEGK